MTKFKDVKLLKKEEISKYNLPDELVSYLSGSHHYKELLYEPLIKHIEDLYRYYNSFYEFSSVEFSTTALIALERANSIDKFYYYAKKILDETIELIPKADKDITLRVSSSKLDSIIKSTELNFINIVDEMYDGNKVNLYEVGRNFAKVEFVLEVVYDDFLFKLLDNGKKVLQDYLASLTEETDDP